VGASPEGFYMNNGWERDFPALLTRQVHGG